MYIDAELLYLRNDIYLLKGNNDEDIVYAPLQGLSFYCTPRDAEELRRFIEDGRMVNDRELKNYLYDILNSEKEKPHDILELHRLDKAMFILTQRCNLACSYCFSQESRSSDTLDIYTIQAVIDYVISYNTNHQKVFTFIGGGEPFVEWNLLKSAIVEIVTRCNSKKINHQIRIVTNSTLVTEEKASWLADKNVVISVSFDILQDVQDRQRPFPNREKSSFTSVIKSLDLLRKYKIPFTFRATITPINVNRMLEMAHFIIDNYPEIKTIHFEPVTDDSIDNIVFFRTFTESFINTIKEMERSGVFLTNSYVSAFEHVKKHTCQGEFCVVPDGSIIACHRHSSIYDRHFDKFKFGYVQDSKVIIDDNKVKAVVQLREERYIECETCFAKWHCAGGCSSKRLVYSVENNRIHCEFIRNFIRSYIEYQLNKKIYETNQSS